MELRTILYGYEKYQFEYFINENEAAIVRRIFEEYLSGKTLLQIGKGLSEEGIAYYKDRTTWSKQAVRRILENAHYTGDKEYPTIVDRKIFRKANDLRLGKGGDREKDSEEIHYLKYHTRCMQCGGRYTRRNHYSGQRERWYCVNGCKTPKYLDDNAFFGEIIDIVNAVTANPELLITARREDKLYQPTIQVQRNERTMNNILSQEALNFQTAKKALFDLLSEQFDCCEMERSGAVTDALIEYMKGCKPIDAIDVALFKVILSGIQVDESGTVALRFTNDAVISAERGEEHE